MKKRLLYLIYSLLFFLPATVMAQAPTPVTLGTSPYTENFDNIGTALPNGFGAYLSATTTSLGTVVTAPILTPGTTTYWNATGAGFKNFASADGQPAAGTTSTTDQTSATNRAFGVRQTSSTGYDPGASFVFQIANTTGKKNLKLSFALQSLDISTAVTRTTTWVVDYGFGASPTTFVTANATGTLVTGNMVFSNNTINVDFGNALDEQSGIITIRISALAASTGSGSRASTAIDDFSLSWSNPVTLTANPTSLDFGTNQTVNSTSAAKSFVLSGTGVTAATTLNVTGPYTISATSGGTYGTSLSIAATDLAASPSVFVKFTPTAAGASPGSIAIASGSGNTSVSLTGSGVSVANPAVLTVTPATLTFTNQTVNTSSAPQFFNFTATNLSDVVTATASGPYLVSKDGLAFTNVVSYTTAEAGVAGGPKVYVQFTPTATGAAPASTITIATTTAAAKTVALTGTGVVATPPAGIANHIVMSEVYGGGGNANAPFTNDFVELYNPTNADVTMTNWSLQYTSAAGTTWGAGGTNPTIASFTGTIKSHGFFLIQLAAGTSVTNKPLPTPDATGPINMSAASGKVALVNNSTQISQVANPTDASIVDLVGFFYSGTAPTGYETTAVTVPSTFVGNTWSIERKANANSTQATLTSGGSDELFGNGYDTDNNSTDFVGQSVPNPQNSASPLESIPVPTYAATPTTLTFSQNVNTTSTGVPVTLSGLGTLPATSVGTSGPYLISKTATGGYASTLTFTAAEMAAATKPVVYVQFTPTALGAANSNLYITGVGAVQQTIPLNGTGTAQPVPTLTATPSTLTFSTFAGTTAPVQNYTLSGTNITQPTNLTVTGPYLISKDNVTFASTVSFATTELNAAQTPKVYVQFTPTVVGASNGTVVQTTTGGGTVSATVTLNGTGVTPPNVAPTFNAIADQSVCAVTTPGSIAVSGITVGPASETTSQAIKSFIVTSNNPTLFASLGTTPVISGASTINYAIANGKTGTAIVTVTLKDNGGVLNGGVDSLQRTFTVTVNALAQVSITSDALNNIVEKGATATLTATGGTTYAWTAVPTITSGLANASVTIRPTATTTYTVAATNASGCITTQTITITVRNASKLETGNVLTPNGDGKNDYWVIRNIDLYSGNTVKVFDKTGKMVFTKTGYNNDWNGYYNGSPLAQGTYYYVVDLGVGLPYKGTLSVVWDK